MIFPRKVYAIQHNITKKIYIGSSINPETRYKTHMYSLRHDKHPVREMQNDFNKYGEDYSVYILDTINDYSEKDKEYEWMERYQTRDRKKGYNYNDVQYKRFVVPLKSGKPEIN